MILCCYNADVKMKNKYTLNRFQTCLISNNQLLQWGQQDGRTILPAAGCGPVWETALAFLWGDKKRDLPHYISCCLTICMHRTSARQIIRCSFQHDCRPTCFGHTQWCLWLFGFFLVSCAMKMLWDFSEITKYGWAISSKQLRIDPKWIKWCVFALANITHWNLVWLLGQT